MNGLAYDMFDVGRQSFEDGNFFVSSKNLFRDLLIQHRLIVVVVDDQGDNARCFYYQCFQIEHYEKKTSKDNPNHSSQLTTTTNHRAVKATVSALKFIAVINFNLLKSRKSDGAKQLRPVGMDTQKTRNSSSVALTDNSPIPILNNKSNSRLNVVNRIKTESKPRQLNNFFFGYYFCAIHPVQNIQTTIELYNHEQVRDNSCKQKSTQATIALLLKMALNIQKNKTTNTNTNKQVKHSRLNEINSDAAVLQIDLDDNSIWLLFGKLEIDWIVDTFKIEKEETKDERVRMRRIKGKRDHNEQSVVRLSISNSKANNTNTKQRIGFYFCFCKCRQQTTIEQSFNCAIECSGNSSSRGSQNPKTNKTVPIGTPSTSASTVLKSLLDNINNNLQSPMIVHHHQLQFLQSLIQLEQVNTLLVLNHHETTKTTVIIVLSLLNNKTNNNVLINHQQNGNNFEISEILLESRIIIPFIHQVRSTIINLFNYFQNDFILSNSENILVIEKMCSKSEHEQEKTKCLNDDNKLNNYSNYSSNYYFVHSSCEESICDQSECSSPFPSSRFPLHLELNNSITFPSITQNEMTINQTQADEGDEEKEMQKSQNRIKSKNCQNLNNIETLFQCLTPKSNSKRNNNNDNENIDVLHIILQFFFILFVNLNIFILIIQTLFYVILLIYAKCFIIPASVCYAFRHYCDDYNNFVYKITCDFTEGKTKSSAYQRLFGKFTKRFSCEWIRNFQEASSTATTTSSSASKPTVLLSIAYFLLIVLLSPSSVYAGAHERRLLNDLLGNYQILERPVANESEVLMVRFGITLQQVIDVDEKNQLIITNTWLKMEWDDTNLRWNPEDYGGITSLRIAPDRVWRPDILMYNSADEKFDGTYHTNVVVLHNGSCTYLPPGIFKSTCKIDITWFPFDDQFCDLKFGSWTYQSNNLDLQLNNASGDVSTYIPNGEFILLSLPGQRNELRYECCPDAYIDITFRIGLRRRTLYYGFNLIVPSVIISSMTLLSFTLPPDSGEKLTLGVTILLSLIVFLMQLAEIMPATSDSVSIIGSYFACIMVMVAFSVVMTVVVLNFHHRTTEQKQEMPNWIRKVICTWLPWILRIPMPPGLFLPDPIKRTRDGEPIDPTKLGILSNHQQIPFESTANRPTPLYSGFQPTPSSPTHAELFMLTEKMREYESLCHRRGCPSVASNSSTRQASGTLVGNHVPYGAPPTTVPQVANATNGFGCNGGVNDNVRHRGGMVGSKCPYAYTSFPPPPAHSHHYDDHQGGDGGGHGGGHQGYLFSMLGSTEDPVTFDTGAGGGGPSQTDQFTSLGQCCCCCCTGSGAAQSQDFFSSVMLELRFITNRLRREDDLTDIIGEWKFAAIVIDRLCLIVFSTFAVISTAVCLLSAPHLIA